MPQLFAVAYNGKSFRLSMLILATVMLVKTEDHFAIVASCTLNSGEGFRMRKLVLFAVIGEPNAQAAPSLTGRAGSRVMFKLLLALCALTLCLGVLEPAQADTLYNNLSNAPGSVLGVFPIGGPPVGAGPEGDSFSTAASPFLLTDVLLKLQGIQDSATFNVSLYSDNNTMCVPGPVCSGGPLTPLYTIATVSDNSLSTSLANYDFSLTSPQTLAANTRYWILASSTNSSGTLWSYTEDLSGAGVAGEFNVANIGLNPSDPSGVLPNSTETGCFVKVSPTATANACTPFQMEVVGTVPEPNTLLLLGSGLLGLWALAARSKRFAPSSSC
jgi:hypothetical protein